ncbi:hypothetical protein [Dendronalium phyllosphericum]
MISLLHSNKLAQPAFEGIKVRNSKRSPALFARVGNGSLDC